MASSTLPVIPWDRIDDLHNLEVATTADLILFMAGNQFMAIGALVHAFQQEHPEVETVFYETLPPGLELKQIMSGGARFRDQILPGRPDIYTSVSREGMQQLEAAGHIDPGDARLYLHNRLALMVPAGNPANIRSVTDLGRDDVRISQPDPQNEDIAFHIIDMYRQAGGHELADRIMETKRAEGTTILTIVHHRETPLRIAKNTVDVGPVWATEISHARASGLACEVVEPGPQLDQRHHINYYICRLKEAPHPANADKFLAFVQSAAAQDIYRRYDFLPHMD